MLWILRTGAQWRESPERFPPHQTVHRRFQPWVCCGHLEKALCALAGQLHEEAELDLEGGILDGRDARA